MVDGFLGRWSQRKIAIKEGKPVEEVVPAAKPAAAVDQASVATSKSPATDNQTGSTSAPAGVWGQPNFQAYGAPAPAPASAPAPEVEAEPSAPEPPPTLADAQTLTPQSDFKPYMSAQVTPEVRNAAMKKLFADPHFNVMDGLDIYIDDYTKPDPLPMSMMRQMASANFLGLFDDEKKQEAALAAAEQFADASQSEPQLKPEAPEQMPANFEAQMPANHEAQLPAITQASPHAAQTSSSPTGDTSPDAPLKIAHDHPDL